MTGSARSGFAGRSRSSLCSFVAFLIWELTRHDPLVKLRVFLNRNFTLGCLLIGLFGGVIYGLITLLPLFYQELLGYNALNAGMAVSPRGFGAVVAMPLIGIIEQPHRQSLHPGPRLCNLRLLRLVVCPRQP